MVKHRISLLATLTLVGVVPISAVHARPAPTLPHQPSPALFPAGSKIAVTNSLSNFQKSCTWDLDCSNGATPVVHSRDEDAMGRLSGWRVFANWQGPQRQQMTFTLYGSSFVSSAQAQAAVADYQAQLTGRQFKLTAFPCPSLLTRVVGRPLCARYHDHSVLRGHWFSVAAAEGTDEIELSSYANTRYSDLRRFTFAQVVAAFKDYSVDRPRWRTGLDPRLIRENRLHRGFN